MTPRMRQILEFVIANGEAKARDVAENFGMSRRTASGYLWTLRNMGHVRCNSPGREATWTADACRGPCSVFHYANQ